MHNVSVVYLCREFSGEVQVDPSEGREAAFFSLSDLPAAITPPCRLILDDLERRYDGIVKRG